MKVLHETVSDHFCLCKEQHTMHCPSSCCHAVNCVAVQTLSHRSALTQICRYGTNHKANTSSPSGKWDWVSGAVNLYSSHDLATWHNKAPVFTAAALPAALGQDLGASGPYRYYGILIMLSQTCVLWQSGASLVHCSL